LKYDIFVEQKKIDDDDEINQEDEMELLATAAISLVDNFALNDHYATITQLLLSPFLTKPKHLSDATFKSITLPCRMYEYNHETKTSNMTPALLGAAVRLYGSRNKI
jgi:hypothetical protein